MRKKIVVAIAFFALLGTGAFVGLSSKANASASSDCPNGCLENGDGCVCNGYWMCLLEDGDNTRLRESYEGGTLN